MTENFSLPTSYKYGKVVGRIIHAVADTSEDPDALPEARPASGKIVFTPAEKIRKVVDADYPAIAMHETFESTLNASGRITDSENRVGIWLLEGAWRVEFKLDAGSIDAFDILVTDQHTDLAPLDIISAVPYVPPTGVSVINMLVPSGGQPGQTMVLTESGGTEVVWADVGSSKVLLATLTDVTGTAATFSSIPSGYQALRVEWEASQFNSGGRARALTMNGDTGANYATSGNAGGQLSIPVLAPQNGQQAAWIEIADYDSARAWKIISGQSVGSTNAGNSSIAVATLGGAWLSTAAVTSLTFTPNHVSDVATYRLYGVN